MSLLRRLAPVAAALAISVPAAGAAAQDAAAPAPFPLGMTATFDLIDQFGARRTEADLAGEAGDGLTALFFGYANCPSVCPVALPHLAAAMDLLGPDAARVTPVLVTVDPERDTPPALRAAMAALHPAFVGLTGGERALAAARESLQVSVGKVAEDGEGGAIYAHGAFIYLLDPAGRVLALLPPVLDEARLAETMRRYLGPPGS